MKGGKRTAKGRIINIDDVIAAAPHATAVGNMKINAQGDKLGPGGEVVQTREKRTRAYYKDHPQASNKKVSLKGDMAEPFEQDQTSFAGLKPDTADTGFENVRTADTDIQEPEAPEPEEFDSPEPTGFREVELDNGDIEMQPYWDDQEDDEDTGSKLA
jgi:hypothetical protein